ncbi:Sodium, potassium, lithium and rubidium/H(+) antiporter [Actinomyces bovis]|uniref:Sodium, potassium, lithium and rubidium/H(+) antiporter n=1 Tax=Actinomyces bovis TaxID=1658 RepID=A0ABY1VSE4_9ACTO|nr:cation:proton antiporter [Actinomyces bovis]SPT53953.1 Sodium, potassium, lithium and rubidium/H(+) antiporter [Actinomyces bovis]VEG53473.1 Sodium, potassium, lithium and rubidium/H(+) antiporter [Actinomyces israelii]
MESLVIAVVALLVIAACNQLAPKVGLASPLILLTLGIGVGFIPWVQAIEVEPELILEGVLPPMLFATAVSMPVMDFRRELRSVAALAVGLVLVSAVLLGLVVQLLVPPISLPWAIALGAVLSPTDAVAVAIARVMGVNHRIITVLEGEGLFNDATALVLLSSAVAAGLDAGAGALRPASLAIGFVQALAVAVLVGWLVGEATIRLRRRVTDPAADTVISFTVPFLASIPAEHLGGSGLVAAVVAGLVVSVHGPKLLPPGNRRAADTNWRTIELVLEGGVFLVMGLQAYGIVHELQVDPATPTVSHAILLAGLAGALILVVRAIFVAAILFWLRQARRRNQRRLHLYEERLARFEDRLAHSCDVDEELLASRHLSPEAWQQALDRWHNRLDRGRRRQQRARNDLAYFTAATLGPREGAVIIWAGMRGAVTLAAAQTLPLSAPLRPLLLLVALLVAAGSLVIQGLTLPLLVRVVNPLMAAAGEDEEEKLRVLKIMRNVVKESALAETLREQVPEESRGLTKSFSTVGRALAANAPTKLPHELSQSQLRGLAVEAIHAQRDALLEARDEGLFSSTTLQYALERLDAEEVMLAAHH